MFDALCVYRQIKKIYASRKLCGINTYAVLICLITDKCSKFVKATRMSWMKKGEAVIINYFLQVCYLKITDSVLYKTKSL